MNLSVADKGIKVEKEKLSRKEFKIMALPDHFQTVKVFESKRERSPSVVLKHNGQLGFSKGFDKLIGKQSKNREGEQKHLKFGYLKESREMAISFEDKPVNELTVPVSTTTAKAIVGIKRVINTLNDDLSPPPDHRYIFSVKDESLEIDHQQKYCILRFGKVKPVPISYREKKKLANTSKSTDA